VQIGVYEKTETKGILSPLALPSMWGSDIFHYHFLGVSVPKYFSPGSETHFILIVSKIVKQQGSCPNFVLLQTHLSGF
jgi:hypothetical protein